jgi:hypothetical protein
MSQVSTVRVYILRAGYLLIAVGLAFMIWPGIIDHSDELPHMNGVVRSMLGAVSLLAIVGIRYPLQMLPVMFFELVWKLIWLIAFGLPVWYSGGLDADRSSTLGDCIFGVVVVLIVIPWDYVLDHYLKRAGDRWRSGISESPAGERSH